MLSDEDLSARFAALNTPQAGQSRIRHIRAHLPARACRPNSATHRCRYASCKMGFTVDAPAWNPHGAALITYEYNPEIEEFYPKPTQLKIAFTNRAGKAQTALLTPDVLCVEKHRFVFVQHISEAELERLAPLHPDRFKVDDGRWRCPPAEVAAAELGCEFELKSGKDLNWALVENLELLGDFWLDNAPAILDEHRRLLQAKLAANSYATAQELIHHEPTVPADALLALIAGHEVWFDLFNERLSDLEHAYVFRDELTAQAFRTMLAQKPAADRIAGSFRLSLAVGNSVMWDGKPWKVLNLGDSAVSLASTSAGEAEPRLTELAWNHFEQLAAAGSIAPLALPIDASSNAEAHALLRKAGPEQLQTAVWKHQILFGEPDQENALTTACRRTQAYWRAGWRHAELTYGNGFVGLLTRYVGNRTRKVDAESLNLMRKVIVEEYETKKQKNRLLCHASYVSQCADTLVPASYRAFCAAIEQRRNYKQTAERIGEKAAYDERPQYLELDYTTPRHGVRPFHIGHIDHTPLPLVLVDKSLAHVVKQLWQSMLVDANTRVVLGFYLSYDKPSARTNMMVIRDCVRRHGRIPLWIVTDGGPEFQSVHYESLLARLGSHKKDRRTSKPRDGAPIERIFNTTVDQFIHALLGNTQIYEHFRKISPELDPPRYAVWTLELLAIRFDEYLRTVYHCNRHSTLGMSPSQAMAFGFRQFGARRHTLIAYTHEFKIWTCPSTLKGSATVTPRGVKINYRYHNCPAFRLAGVRGREVPVRYDPDNAGLAHAYVNGQWHDCYSELYAIFKGYSERAIRIVTHRLHLQNRENNQALEINAQRLAEFLMSVEGQEAVELQRLRDAEAAAQDAAINAAAEADPPGASEGPDDFACQRFDQPEFAATDVEMLEPL